MVGGSLEPYAGEEGGAMRYVFGNCILDTQRYELRRAGTRIPLRPKVFQVLAYLLAHRDRLVPKQELLEHVWPGQFISDATLNSCIMAVRKALEDGGRTPRCLQTVHGQGYRFVAPVEEQAHLRADEAPPAAPSTAGAPHTLAPHGGATHQEETFLPPFPVNADTLDGEHKQVTVLCCALVEAPMLAARLGPEAMHHLMRDVLALAQATVQRYDGTLTHVSGDGFLALFGAPVAQEDHARRAVLAALELHQRLRAPDVVRGQPPGVALVIRMGLHTGPVVVGPLAHDPQRPYTAVGDTLTLATRLQRRAAPDTILVSAATHALVQDEVQSVACGTLSSDAPAAPVSVYAVCGITQRHAGVPRRGARPLSRFVGRARELALLHERLEQTVDGQGQVIGIAGEPGLGKSRLLSEFAWSLDGQPVTYCEGQCLAYGSATPYLPVLALLRQRCGITDGDSPVVITTKVHQALREVDIAPEEGAPVLLRLLDVPIEMVLLAPLSCLP
jgi:class 3 adenylate cyclase/DNA-binding winged helix-turn-helix (wHTH) protein